MILSLLPWGGQLRLETVLEGERIIWVVMGKPIRITTTDPFMNFDLEGEPGDLSAPKQVIPSMAVGSYGASTNISPLH